MLLSRIFVILLATDIGYRRYTKIRSSTTVNAFGICLPSSSRNLLKESCTSLGSVIDDENSEHFLLLDESVLLYSRLKIESPNDDDDDETESQRKEELTTLIEDVVFDGSGIVRDDGLAENDEPESVEETTTTEELSTLDEISLALDEQILLGSQTTFTEDELQAWIAKIDSLRDKLQSQLIALPPSATTTLQNKTPPPEEAPGIDRLRSRLESMRTSIDPTESPR